MPHPNDTICAIATATGGAIAIIRISGSNTFCILGKVFSKPIEDAHPYTLHHGVISDHEGKAIDEVLVSIFRSPHSYTGEDSAEISFHGSPYIAQQILSCLTQQDCRQANPGEFTQRAYLNGKLDLSQAEAVADLIASTNRATHKIAMSQLKGHFSSELKKLRDQLLQLTSLLELELDFSDHEDLEFADRTELLELAQKIDTRIQQLTQSFETGQALKNGIPVAIIGAPNVGKSTLLNALLGEERAIVSDIQGTTRDTIEDTIQIDGITFRFIDTAGIRHTTDRIESLGIGRTLTAAQRATIILMVTEPGIPYPNVPIRSDQTVIRIENKTETFQAKYGIGLDDLRTQILAAAPHTTDTDIIVTNARHYDALLRAHQSLLHVLDGLHQQLPGDLLSEDLRQTLDILAEITGGQITPQETLNNIFSHFCVGK
ncbi:MAG: tRNA uridine-5-carboxymethylaminomethyl(34) synthesis GTPase MnmE [Bacteroidaceae bacterium]|nr:tRNA uridine-5-carboxymethylaminomethyl(34) synthesis GTPase MnmE [Bacteroidaceae bacterium]